MIQGTPLVQGVVVDTADPQEMGRLRVWIPGIDGENPDVPNLPWVQYMTPLGGQASGYPAGSTSQPAEGPVSYGFWAIPKVGAQVVVGFLHGDYNQRVYIGSLFRDHGNRSLPVGRNADGAAPTSDSYDPLEPQLSNLKAQFQGDLSNSIARTRGAYERQVAQAGDVKTDAEGYMPRVSKDTEPGVGDLDPQTYCITTPGRHSIIMQDHPKFARVRVKTAEGHQIILDDANERIYVSTAKGRTWIELDQDGHVHLYGAESISLSAGGDFNIQALGNINLAAGGNVNVGAAGYARVTACADLALTGKGVFLTSGGGIDFKAAGDILQTGSNIHLNGPSASEGECAIPPTIVPSMEPWTRPDTAGTRGKHWKP